MLKPIRVTAPATLPVSLTEARQQCRVTNASEDALLAAYIAAAVNYLDGWSGQLGRAIVTQTWRQDFACFDRVLRLPLGPVQSVVSVGYLDAKKAEQTLSPSAYGLYTDDLGSYVTPLAGVVLPSTGDRVDAVRVTYIAGVAASSETLLALKQAILLLVGHWFSNREALTETPMSEMPLGFRVLIGGYQSG